jgi:tRNA(Arg) A34 adenosine deaminase TadA
MLKTKISIVFFTLILLACLLFLLKPLLYRFHSEKTLPPSQLQMLVENASQSLASNDVPVGSLLIYNDSILSTGFNTVYRDSNAGGHAEINAISNAIRKIGFEAFSKLDRKKLVLVSTFEPCMMCQGAIIEYNIRNVYFLKGKGLLHWWKNDLKLVRYEWNKFKSDGAELQDSLFDLHPKYKAVHSRQ